MSLRIRFVRLRKSEMIKEAVEDRLSPILNKFDIFDEEKIHFEVEMENSPHQAGRDLFSVRLSIRGGKMRGFSIEKKDTNFYRALSSMAASLPININRFRQRRLKRGLNEQRKVKNVASF